MWAKEKEKEKNKKQKPLNQTMYLVIYLHWGLKITED